MNTADAPEHAEIAAAAWVALAIGLAFVVIGVLQFALANRWTGVVIMAIGCYCVAAASLAIRRGRPARPVLAPAVALSFGGVIALALAAG